MSNYSRDYRQCLYYGHLWSNWGPYHVALPSVSVSTRTPDTPPPEKPVTRTYRFRSCSCGMVEREDYEGNREVVRPTNEHQPKENSDASSD